MGAIKATPEKASLFSGCMFVCVCLCVCETVGLCAHRCFSAAGDADIPQLLLCLASRVHVHVCHKQ